MDVSGPSVVHRQRNEGVYGCAIAVCSILDICLPTAEIVVVDDFSSDGSSDGVQIDDRISVLRLTRHTGAPIGRNPRRRQDHRQHHCFADAHVRRSSGWCSTAFPIAQPVAWSGARGTGHLRHGDPSAKGYGFGIYRAGLDWAWLPPAA